MRRKGYAVTSIAVLTLIVGTLSTRVGRSADTATERSTAAEGSCDYSCLTAMVDQYLKALEAHDPHQIPTANQVKFTENTIPLKLGDALWATMSGMGTCKLYFADPPDGQVGFEGTIRENGTPAVLLLRLRVAHGDITEVETLVHRNAEDAGALEKLGQPNPLWLRPLDASQKTPRQEMVKDVNLYFEGILHSSGDMVPF
jgi:hypothetical protein